MTYDEIRAALSAYTHRTDAPTIANEPTALALALVAVGTVFYPREAVKVATVALTGNAGPVPAGFGRAEVVGADLAYMSPREWAGQTLPDAAGLFTLVGEELRIGGPAVASVVLTYYELPGTITGAASNWLSRVYPAVWIHAARAEQYRFLEDIDAAGVEDSYWRGMVDKFIDESRRVESRGGAIRMRSR